MVWLLTYFCYPSCVRTVNNRQKCVIDRAHAHGTVRYVICYYPCARINKVYDRIRTPRSKILATPMTLM